MEADGAGGSGRAGKAGETRSILARYRKIIFAVILFMIANAMVIGIDFYDTCQADESAVSINLSERQRMPSSKFFS